MHPGHRAKVATAIVLLTVLALTMSGCTTSNNSSQHPQGAASSNEAPGSTATARPTQPIPDRKPDGVVDPPSGHGMSRYTGQTLNWKKCQSGKQCATVRAPLDYQKPDDQAVTLALARKKSSAGKANHTLFVNPGGPGGSGTDFVDNFKPHGLDASYDVMSWDPRGVGQSTPVHCFGSSKMEKFTAMDAAPENAKAKRAWKNENVSFGKACLAKSGKLLKHISTVDTVRDLNLLRELVGDKKVNYLGSSYGTSIGAMYASKFPEKVGHMVLDGATSIGGAPSVSQVEGFDRTLNHFASWCAKKYCRLGSSRNEVLTAISKLLSRLDSHTIPAGRRDLTQTLAVTGVFFALYSPADQWKTLERGLEKAIYDDDGTKLLIWADTYNQRDQAGNFGQFNAAFPAIRCLDKKDSGIAGALRTWKRDKKRAPTLGKFFGPDFSCPTWPVKTTKDVEKPISYDSKPPVMILGNTGDPATPYEYAKHMHKELKSSRLVTLKANGHLAFDQSRCVQHKVRSFLLDGRSPKSDSTCTDGQS